MEFAAKRVRTNDDADFMYDSRPAATVHDHPSIIAALGTVARADRDAFETWLNTLHIDVMKRLKKDLAEMSRTGNMRFVATKLCDLMAEMVAVNQLKARAEMTQAYLVAVMMRSMKNAGLNQQSLNDLVVARVAVMERDVAMG